jgi:hypothetical protein
MRNTAQNLHKSDAIKGEGAARGSRRGVRLPVGSDRQKVAAVIHHCLKYLSADARRNGMSQTASILDMAAHLAVDEARATRG